MDFGSNILVIERAGRGSNMSAQSFNLMKLRHAPWSPITRVELISPKIQKKWIATNIFHRVAQFWQNAYRPREKQVSFTVLHWHASAFRLGIIVFCNPWPRLCYIIFREVRGTSFKNNQRSIFCQWSFIEHMETHLTIGNRLIREGCQEKNNIWMLWMMSRMDILLLMWHLSRAKE